MQLTKITMKKTIFFALAILSLTWGCQKQPAEQVKLTGTILNADTLLVRFIEGRNADTITLAADGGFVYEKEMTQSISGNLVVDRKNIPIYLVPGKELILTVDYADWDNTLAFDGDLKAVADYLIDKSKVQREWSRGLRAQYLKEPTDYRASRDSLTEVFHSMLNAKKLEAGFDQDFAEIESLSIQFTQIMDMKNYVSAHQYYTEKDTVILPDNWNSLEEGIDLNHPMLVNVPAAMSYLSNNVNNQAQKEAGLTGDLWGKPDFLAAKFNYIQKTFTSPELIENLMYRELSQQMDANGIGGIGDQLQAYYALAKNSDQLTEIKTTVAQWEAIQPGKPAPDFKVVDMQGVEHTLAEYRGKYVYIDFWATWCGPCKIEIPHLKDLYEEYKDSNLAIMSISVDRDKSAWEKMVTEEGFSWLQFHDATMENDKYIVKYIPTFVLIGPDGNIINCRAPRPSEPELKIVLEGLNISGSLDQ
jgi:thiol-disulfide isomerase/thioredoxin